MPGRKRKTRSQSTAAGGGDMWGSGSSSGSRRKGAGLTTTASSSTRGSSSRGGSASSPSATEAHAAKLFQRYNDDDDPNVATMEGISTLCDDIGIDGEEDVRVLVLLWKLGAVERPAQISREEWVKGCTKMSIDSVDKVKALLPTFDTGFLDQEEFKDFYKFAFQFNREGTHRTLDRGLVIALLQLVLKERIDRERLSTFVTFLEGLKGDTNSRITLDQWTSFLDFCYEVEDLETDYDEEASAWPVLIDEYVEYMRESQK